MNKKFETIQKGLYTIEVFILKDNTFKSSLYLKNVYCSNSQRHFLNENNLNEIKRGANFSQLGV